MRRTNMLPGWGRLSRRRRTVELTEERKQVIHVRRDDRHQHGDQLKSIFVLCEKCRVLDRYGLGGSRQFVFLLWVKLHGLPQGPVRHALARAHDGRLYTRK